MKFFHLIFLLLILTISTPVLSQRKKNTAKADSAYSSSDYGKAIQRYTKVYPKLKNKEQKANVAFKLAQSYWHMNDIRKARSYFKKARRAGYADPLATLRIAECHKIEGNYEDAVAEYNEYKNLMPDDPSAEKGKKSCELALKWMKSPTRFTVKPIRAINTKQDDYAPCVVADNEIIFSSTRDGSIGSKVNNFSNQSFSDLWLTQKDNKNTWSTPVPLAGSINTADDEGVSSISSDKKRLYYTYAEGGKKVYSTVKIFFSANEGQVWSKPSEIKMFKDSSISVAHPAVSDDELTMYFASDQKKDGFGGYDIWVSKRKNKSEKWGKPKNMGSTFNSSGNELFPSITDEGVLYFSSNGLVGMGGLDIFKAEQDDNGKWVVENMKYPINSSKDDFGMTFNADKKSGFFTSARKVDDTRGRDDIFEFSLPSIKFDLTVKVIDSEMGMPLPGTKIKLFGSDGTLVQGETNSSGEYLVKLKENTDYRATTERENYLKGKGKESTKGLQGAKQLSMVIAIEQLGRTIQVENIFYELASAELRPESFIELDKLVEKMQDNPKVSFALSAHTDYRGDDKYNEDLSQQRAQSVVNYLVSKGISLERLAPKGYGETQPKKISKKISEKHAFLKEGDILTEEFITSLKSEEQQEICNQMNRRTEFIGIQQGKKKTFYFDDGK